MLDWIQSYFLTEHAYNHRSNQLFYYLPLYTYYNSFAPSTCKLWNNLHAGKKFHQLYLSLSQNLKNKIYLKLTKISVKEIGNIILRQLRNKASKAYLFKDFFIWCESMFILWVWIWRKYECRKYTQQRDELFKQLIDISVPFYMNYIIYGSSDFSYR